MQVVACPLNQPCEDHSFSFPLLKLLSFLKSIGSIREMIDNIDDFCLTVLSRLIGSLRYKCNGVENGIKVIEIEMRVANLFDEIILSQVIPDDDKYSLFGRLVLALPVIYYHIIQKFMVFLEMYSIDVLIHLKHPYLVKQMLQIS